MDLSYPPEIEAFRKEVRAWLEENLPRGWGTPQFKLPEDPRARHEWQLAWHKKLYSAGYIGMAWPREYGGGGKDPALTVALSEEFVRYRAPSGTNGLGISIVGPTIMRFGTEEQKRRFLPKMLSGDELWCLGMSEPGAGSDLASLQTRAVEDGDFFVVNGQKVWTSSAHVANYVYLLVRTDPNAEKHRGISALLVDMKTPGIVVRPLKQITGGAEFNEVFFTDVRVPKSALLGEKNQGWRVAMGQLGYERSGGSRGITDQRNLEDAVRLATKVYRNGQPAIEDPVVMGKIGQLAIEVNISRLLGYREMTNQMQGLNPGPEASFGKLFASEMTQRLQTLMMEVLGPEGFLATGSPDAADDRDHLYAFLYSFAATLQRGSSEINRNIIAERVLGLPRG